MASFGPFVPSVYNMPPESKSLWDMNLCKRIVEIFRLPEFTTDLNKILLQDVFLQLNTFTFPP